MPRPPFAGPGLALLSVSILALSSACSDDGPSAVPDAATDLPVASGDQGPVVDQASPDLTAPDAAAPDALVPDALVPDAPASDALTFDAPAPDAPAPDAAVPDAAVPDMGPDIGCALGTTTPCYTGPANTLGKGICVPGTKYCTLTGWSPCWGSVTPQTETCNDKDDDCNGTTDDGLPGGAACTLTTTYGLCKVGQMTCVKGKLDCTQVVFPKTEVCNNKDDDCDNKVDDGATCPKGTTCTSGACKTCSQPADNKCPETLGICIADAKCPACVCGYKCYCKQKSALGYCYIASCY